VPVTTLELLNSNWPFNPTAAPVLPETYWTIAAVVASSVEIPPPEVLAPRIDPLAVLLMLEMSWEVGVAAEACTIRPVVYTLLTNEFASVTNAAFATITPEDALSKKLYFSPPILMLAAVVPVCAPMKMELER
jgi:hypothetical protein